MVKHEDNLKIIKAILEINPQLVESLDYEIIKDIRSEKIYIVFSVKQEKDFVEKLKKALLESGIKVGCTFIFDE